VTPPTDRVTGDLLTVNYVGATFGDKNVASAKPVTVTGITVAGPDALNYAYKNSSITAANITPRSLNLTFTGVNKVYNGNTAAVVTPETTVSRATCSPSAT
jgi:hypothetical protein